MECSNAFRPFWAVLQKEGMRITLYGILGSAAHLIGNEDDVRTAQARARSLEVLAQQHLRRASPPDAEQALAFSRSWATESLRSWALCSPPWASLRSPGWLCSSVTTLLDTRRGKIPGVFAILGDGVFAILGALFAAAGLFALTWLAVQLGDDSAAALAAEPFVFNAHLRGQ